MSRFTVTPYTPADRLTWNAMTESSRNGTFLLQREYMEYHADRIEDFSLIVRGADGKPVTLFAASRHGDQVRAHGGLTYGGFILPRRGVDAATILEIFDAVKDYARALGVKSILYKPVPHIYHSYPAEEDLYALFRSGAVMTQGNVSMVVDLKDPLPMRRDTRHHISLAAKRGWRCAESDDFATFWDMLTARLDERYAATPVHSLEEITRLHSLFPDNIRLFMVYGDNDEPTGGTVLYFTPQTVHSQYIASTAEGRASGAIDFLHKHILDNCCGNARYFDFGTSNEESGMVLNTGLIQQKSGAGGRAVLYPGFTVSL